MVMPFTQSVFEGSRQLRRTVVAMALTLMILPTKSVTATLVSAAWNILMVVVPDANVVGDVVGDVVVTLDEDERLIRPS